MGSATPLNALFRCGGVLALFVVAGCSSGADSVGFFSDPVPPDVVLSTIGADTATATGQQVRVAVVDSGIARTEDLASNVVAGVDFVGTGDTLLGWDDDTDNHGTAVAALIAADADGQGVTGVAPDARLFSYRYVTDDSPGTNDRNLSRVVRRHVTDNIDISNNSWGLIGVTRGNSPNFADEYPDTVRAFRNAQANGTIFVWSAGNDGDIVNGPSSSIDALQGLPLDVPDLMDQWLIVTSTNIDGEESLFTNQCQEAVEFCIAAPGESLTVTNNAGDFQVFSGTSFSAPLVSGALALVTETFPSLTPAAVVTRVKETATYDGLRTARGCTIDTCSEDDMARAFGQGMLDVEAALGVVGILTATSSDIPITRTQLTRPRGVSETQISSASVTAADSFDGAQFDVPLMALAPQPAQIASLGYAPNDTAEEASTRIAFMGTTLHISNTAPVARFWGDKHGFVTEVAPVAMTASLPLDRGFALSGAVTPVTATQFRQSATLSREGVRGPSAALTFALGAHPRTLSSFAGDLETVGNEMSFSLGLRQPVFEQFELFANAIAEQPEDMPAGVLQWGFEEATMLSGVAGVEVEIAPGLRVSGGAYLPEHQVDGIATILVPTRTGYAEERFQTSPSLSTGLFLAAQAPVPMLTTATTRMSLQQSPERANALAEATFEIDIAF